MSITPVYNNFDTYHDPIHPDYCIRHFLSFVVLNKTFLLLKNKNNKIKNENENENCHHNITKCDNATTLIKYKRQH